MYNMKCVQLSCATCHTSCVSSAFHEWRQILRPRICIVQTQSPSRFFNTTCRLTRLSIPLTRTDYGHDTSKSTRSRSHYKLDFRKYTSVLNPFNCQKSRLLVRDSVDCGIVGSGSNILRTLLPSSAVGCCLQNERHKGSSVGRDSFRKLQQRQLTLSPKAIVDASPLSLQPYLKLIRFDRPIGKLTRKCCV